MDRRGARGGRSDQRGSKHGEQQSRPHNPGNDQNRPRQRPPDNPAVSIYSSPHNYGCLSLNKY